MRTSGGAVVVVALILATAACASPGAAPEPSRASQLATSSAVAGLPSGAAPGDGTPSAVPAVGDHDESVPHDHDVPLGHSAEADTTALATRATSLYCRPGLDYDTWINELYPVLPQQAAVAYETVDPANVPCTSVTGAARVRDGDGAYTMRVYVPTDAGEYSVYVHRSSDTAPWAVDQITPPGSE